MNKLIITRTKDRVLSALFEGDRPLSLELEDPADTLHVGDIYQGRVHDVVKNLHAAFVEVRPGVMGYYAMEKDEILKTGDEFPVQITREPVRSKDAVVTRELTIAGKYAVVTSEYSLGVSEKIRDSERKEDLKALLAPVCGDRALGFVIRTNAAEAPDEAILEEAEALADRLEQIRTRAPYATAYSCLSSVGSVYMSLIRDARAPLEIITDLEEVRENAAGFLSTDTTGHSLSFYQDPTLSLSALYRLDKVLADALDRRVWLPSGGYLVIEPTEALTVIDVNTGKYEGKKNKEDTFLKVNLEAAEEIAHQMRLRNLSGIIVADFIDMKREESRRSLFKHMNQLLSKDPVKAYAVDYTQLGLMEMTRKKIRRPLSEQLAAGSPEGAG